MKNSVLTILFCLLSINSYGNTSLSVNKSASDLVFKQLSKTWDEGIPLGNGVVGSLIWEKDSNLRFSLDRTDLWDLRQTDSLSGENFRFAWVKEHIKNGNYEAVQRKLDDPYDMIPAPSKIPGAALEFPLNKIGQPESVELFLNNALCQVNWHNGVELQTFVHADKPVGWFVFRNLPTDDFEPSLSTPVYWTEEYLDLDSPVAGQDLRRLGYSKGKVTKNGNEIVYTQPGFDGYSYKVAVKWDRKGDNLYGVWSITSSLSEDDALDNINQSLENGIDKEYASHQTFWKNFNSQSSVHLPDSILQKQYDNEMYKFGSSTREHSYPISLQSVWTADNGRLPPWKGDYHHDLNTQLSYWPTYTGNHLQEGMGYLNTLWNQRDVFKKYTKDYFEVDGLNVPGVTTLTGEPMGGWIQYALSQTVGAWLAHHFYQHWKYSADNDFLKEKGYPFIKDVAIFLENISDVDENGVRRLEFSSSPEIFDNSVEAWFPTITNYDLSLMKSLFKEAAEMASALGETQEATHWEELGNQLPDFDIDEEGSLTFAKGVPYNESHRHFSHALAIHPLGLIDWNDGEKSQKIINATLKKLEDYGPDYWTGYSYAWLGNMYARAMDGNKAAKALRDFADCFCLVNSFHANGDQSGKGKSRFTYRPFTLEGNFAFASGIQEMLLQSHTGVIRIFPAIPEKWDNVSFDNLRAQGAFLVSANKENGKITNFSITSEKGGEAKYLDPVTNEIRVVSLTPGETFEWENRE